MVWLDFETRSAWIRDRHLTLIEEARVVREVTQPSASVSFRVGIAGLLRQLADYLDTPRPYEEPETIWSP